MLINLYFLCTYLIYVITSGVTKTEVSTESIDQCLQLNEVVQDKGNGSVEIKLENTQQSDEQMSSVEEYEKNESSEVKQDVSVESNQTEIKENGLSEVIELETTKCDSNEAMMIIEDSDNFSKPQRIDGTVILELTSKKDVRQKVWEFLEENSLVVFPKPCFNRIPNFKGCSNATQSLEKLEEFKKAKTVQVTPDKAQETARFLTLSVSRHYTIYLEIIPIPVLIFNSIKILYKVFNLKIKVCYAIKNNNSNTTKIELLLHHVR